MSHSRNLASLSLSSLSISLSWLSRSLVSPDVLNYFVRYIMGPTAAAELSDSRERSVSFSLSLTLSPPLALALGLHSISPFLPSFLPSFRPSASITATWHGRGAVGRKGSLPPPPPPSSSTTTPRAARDILYIYRGARVFGFVRHYLFPAIQWIKKEGAEPLLHYTVFPPDELILFSLAGGSSPRRDKWRRAIRGGQLTLCQSARVCACVRNAPMSIICAGETRWTPISGRAENRRRLISDVSW